MNREEERKRIGQSIAALRKIIKWVDANGYRRTGMTQGELAERCGIAQSHIARIEAGKYSVGFDTLQQIADAMGCDISIVTRPERVLYQQTAQPIEPTAYSQTVKSFSKPKPSPISFKAKAKIDFVSDGIQFEKGKEYDVKELDSFFDKEVERRANSWDDFVHVVKHYRLGIVNGSVIHYFYDERWAKSHRLASFEDFFEKIEELSEK